MPAPAPMRFKNISSISKTPTTNSCCAASEMHTNKNMHSMASFSFFIFHGNKKPNGTNSRILNSIPIKPDSSCAAIAAFIARKTDKIC